MKRSSMPVLPAALATAFAPAPQPQHRHPPAVAAAAAGMLGASAAGKADRVIATMEAGWC